MSRKGIFGWSYPAGCSGPPDDEGPCEICGQAVDICICPMCPVCENAADPNCYKEHGMKLNREQIIARARTRIDDLRARIVDEQRYLQWVEEQNENYTEELR